jgi:hypothetical protein
MSRTTELRPTTTDHPVLKMTLLGLFAGGLLGLSNLLPALSLATPQRGPLPHQIAKYPGGISLRFAMVHDVLHERFPKHGDAYYRARNDSARRQLDTLLSTPPGTTRPTDQAWRLMDDLAVSHVHLGEYDRATEIMRDKLARQQRLGITGQDLYSTYANLGTAMMIAALRDSAAGKDSTPALRQSLDWVRKSIEVNPQAHFGREVWQVVLGEYLLDVSKNPSLLLKYDMVGNELAERPSPRDRAAFRPWPLAPRIAEAIAGKPIDADERSSLRQFITTVGGGGDWQRDTHTSHTHPVPFDEPVLGIVGMWRYGAGANPYFSLALAETMMRVGQWHIAWCGYERTRRLLDGFPDQNAAAELVAHCDARQDDIASILPDDERKSLRPAFEADLKAGLDYQAAYQAYESRRLADGTSVDAPHFYDAFFAQYGDIASNPGHADEVTWRSTTPSQSLPVALLVGGLFGLPTALVIRRRQRLSA